MVKRLHDRDDVTHIRFTRVEPYHLGGRNRSLLEIVDGIFPGGTVFHVIADTPGQSEDLMVIVVDGETVVRFEIPREGGERCIAGPPCDVEIKPLKDFRWASGQRSHRRLDLIAADARRLMMTNGS